MGDYAHKMECLRETRTGRYWMRTILSKPPAVVVAELEENRASTEGDLHCLRERLWRAVLRKDEPEMDVPWFECDKAGSKTLGQIIGVESDTEISSYRESRRNSGTAARTRELEEQDNIEREMSRQQNQQSDQDREKSTPNKKQSDRRDDISDRESEEREAHHEDRRSQANGGGRTPISSAEDDEAAAWGGETPSGANQQVQRTVHADV